MKILLNIIFIILAVIFLGYLAIPNQKAFPAQLPDSLQSKEAGDSETPLRRAYFTNMTREEVMSWYETQLRSSSINNIPLPTLRLNYPPEEAQTLIRDQTRSTFLEELVHPFRESLYVNGFEPKDPKDRIFIEGKVWRQKITVKFVGSSPYLRLAIALPTLGLICFVLLQIKNELKKNV